MSLKSIYQLINQKNVSSKFYCSILFNYKENYELYKILTEVWLGRFFMVIVDYLMPNPLYTYILNLFDLVGLSFMAYQPL